MKSSLPSNLLAHWLLEAQMLEGQVALVTGAASGIGRATALALARAGAAVACADIKSTGETVREVRDLGCAAYAYELDVRNGQAWRRVVDEVLDRYGSVSILANVAGVSSNPEDNALDQTEEMWDFLLTVNLKSVWLGVRAALPTMIERGRGRIINMASLAGQIGIPDLCAYSTAKAGVIGLTRQIAAQYATNGIRANAIAPANIDTPMLGTNSPQMREAMFEKALVKRLGRPEEVADVVLFLASPQTDYITGQVIAIDGGWGAT